MLVRWFALLNKACHLSPYGAFFRGLGIQSIPRSLPLYEYPTLARS